MGGRSSAPTQPKPKRRSKYGAIRTTTSDGISHASKKEAARWVFLLDLQANGVIRNLRRQVRYNLHVQGVKIGGCIPDFEYTICKTGKQVTEDVKGSKFTLTPLYRRNKRHLLVEHGISMVEVFKPDEWGG